MYTIQIVAKHCHSDKEKNNSVNVVKFNNYETNSVSTENNRVIIQIKFCSCLIMFDNITKYELSNNAKVIIELQKWCWFLVFLSCFPAQTPKHH